MTENIKEMQLELMTPTGFLYSLRLPGGKPQGRFSFKEEQIRGFYFEVFRGVWTAVSNGEAIFINKDNEECDRVRVLDMGRCLIKVDEIYYVLYSEEKNNSRNCFVNYRIMGDGPIRIGRNENNEICYNNSLVSGSHAKIIFVNGACRIIDCDSRNGTFVNGRRIRDKELLLGDVVYIMGMRLIVGSDFISMNILDRPVRVDDARIVSLHHFSIPRLKRSNGKKELHMFNRSPRIRKAIKPETIEIEGPPMSMNGNKMPLVLRMGRNVMMGATGMMSGRMLSSLSMMAFPILSDRFSDKEKKEYEQKRVTLYSGYLEEKAKQIKEEIRVEENALRWNYPELSVVLKNTAEEYRLWERQRTDDDYLHIRIGKGNIPMIAEVDYPKEAFSIEEDDLETKMRKLAEERKTLHDVPIRVSLADDFVTGVSGNTMLQEEFIRDFLLQLISTHSYDEVKIIFLCSEEQLQNFSYIRYLPHFWNDQKNMRFLATNPSESYQISEYLKNELEEDLEKKKELNVILKKRPFYLIIGMDRKIFDSMEILKDIMQSDHNPGAAVMAVFDELPKECSKIFQLNAIKNHQILHLKQLDLAPQEFELDRFEPYLAEKAIRKLCNLNLITIDQVFGLPKMLSFLEMFGVGKIEHLNILQRWKDNNPVKSLETPVGVATDGSLFTLNLHEKFQGPHGLVAGMTGSGKSEFIITYILSLAVNFHPDEVAFILIDYKGGGLTGAFDDPANGIHLPHLAGTITNLDGAAIQRSLVSIQSELKRRQKIFNDTKSRVGEGTLDIYGYQKLYRAGVVSEALPHLFIISDEFAELKAQQPAFMEDLVSAARIGRSLGVHLILATQKPTGVVNEQIRSNTKFRVCLKVQDRSDSMDMLKRPEAAELKDTGRFYLQVGYNEFFALGQSAWCGADYEPEEEMVVRKDETIRFLDSVGQTIHSVKPAVLKQSSGKSQLVSIVRYLSDLAVDEGIEVHSIWKEALPSFLPLRELEEKLSENIWDNFSGDTEDCFKGGLQATAPVKSLIGYIDDPERQDQYPLTLDLQNNGHHLIVGEAGSGKTTLLQTLLFGLTLHYRPERVNYLILDYSSHSLRVFEEAPHCIGWFSEQEEDSIDRIFRLLSETVKKRKQLFTEAKAANYSDYVKSHSLPLLLVVIDNPGYISQMKQGNSYYNEMATLMKDGAALGITFVMTISHMSDIITKMKQEMTTRLTLQMKDKYAHAEALDTRCTFVPAVMPGRGLCCVEGRPLEFHTAVCAASPDNPTDYIEAKIQALPGTDYKPELHIDVINEKETYENFYARFTEKNRFPLGYSLSDVKPVVLPFRQFSMLSMYFGNTDSIKPVMKNILYMADRNNMEKLIVKRASTSLFDSCLDERISERSLYRCEQEDLKRLFKNLINILSPRGEKLKKYCEEHGIASSDTNFLKRAKDYMLEHEQPILILLEDFPDVCKTADPDTLKNLGALCAAFARYNCYVIGCYYPEDEKVLLGNALGKEFNKEGLQMMFGGGLDTQPFGMLPRAYSMEKGPGRYNRCLMHYREKYYGLYMPCGIMEEAYVEEDERSIF